MKPPVNRASRWAPFLALIAAAAVPALAAALPACASTGGPPRHIASCPAPTGPMAVGRLSAVIADADRADPYDPAGGERTLRATVWYPAARAGAAPAPLLDRATADAIVEKWGLDAGWLARLRGNSYEDAPCAVPPAGGFPVLLMSHGGGGHPLFYTSWAEELASRGWIVAAAAHPGTSAYAVGADGRLAPVAAAADPAAIARAAAGDFAGQDGAWRASAAVLAVHEDDLLCLLDAVEAMGRAGSGSLLEGRVDASRAGAFGHSFGGAAALGLLFRDDPRVRAAADVDGTVFSDDGLAAGFPKPALSIMEGPIGEAVARVGGREELVAQLVAAGYTAAQAVLTVDRQFAQYDAVRKGRAWWTLILAGTLHLDFTDDDWLAAELPFIPELREDRGTADPAWTRVMVRDCLDSFFRRHVLDDASATFGGAGSPGVRFESRP